VSLRTKAGARGELADGVGQSLFNLPGCFEVFYRAAARADEVVVVVTCELLGDLEASVLVTAHDAVDDPRLFEEGEVPVGRALREALLGGNELGCGEGTASPSQSVDQDPAARGVALARQAEPGNHHGLKVVDHSLSVLPVMRIAIGIVLVLGLAYDPLAL
jgi:hypothetical protein